MRRHMLLTLATAPMLTACVTHEPNASPICTAFSAQDDQQIRLMFGMTRPDGRQIDDAAWQKFLHDDVTPAFPDGFTVVTALGQWRDRVSGHVTQEPSYIIWIATPYKPNIVERLSAIRARYKQIFDQQSVGLIIQSGCESF